MPKILHVITGLGVGGAERTLFNLLEAGLNDRCENHVISLRGLDHLLMHLIFPGNRGIAL